MSDWEDFCDHMGFENDEHADDKLADHINIGNDRAQAHELRNDGYKTVKEWNSVGRSVKRGEKGIHLPYARITMFSESQTIESKFSGQTKSNPSNKRHFQTFEEVVTWAKSNPGKAFTRSPTGEGYIEK